MATLVTRSVFRLMREKAAPVVLGCRLSDQATTGAVKQPPPPQPAAAAPTASDNTKYQVPQYYEYNEYSYYDEEIIMAPTRNKQPSKYTPMPK